MKKLVLFGFGLSLLAFTSCRKDWTCECTASAPTFGQSFSSSSTVYNAKKKDAEKTCESNSTSIMGMATIDCKLK